MLYISTENISILFLWCTEKLAGDGAAERTKEPVGPFRVYLQYSWSPGLACSRAFGDKMAVEVGVTHKPDVTMHRLQPEDRYLIVASDGVWELVSSQVSLTVVCLW